MKKHTLRNWEKSIVHMCKGTRNDLYAVSSERMDRMIQVNVELLAKYGDFYERIRLLVMGMEVALKHETKKTRKKTNRQKA